MDTLTCRSLELQEDHGALTSCVHMSMIALSSTLVAWTRQPSPGYAHCFSTSLETITARRRLPRCVRRWVMHSIHCTTWRTRPACSDLSLRGWAGQAALPGPA